MVRGGGAAAMVRGRRRRQSVGGEKREARLRGRRARGPVGHRLQRRRRRALVRDQLEQDPRRRLGRLRAEVPGAQTGGARLQQLEQDGQARELLAEGRQHGARRVERRVKPEKRVRDVGRAPRQRVQDDIEHGGAGGGDGVLLCLIVRSAVPVFFSVYRRASGRFRRGGS